MFKGPYTFHTVIFIAVFCRVSTLPAIGKSSGELQSMKVPLESLQGIRSSLFKPKSMEEVDAIIDQVDKTLEKDPTLPRLTRGEIEELLNQVSKEEYKKSLQTGDINRATNIRSLMLVLPYNTDNTTEENLQELYTRPPITKVIDSYTNPHPQKFQTPASPTFVKSDVIIGGNIAATTYKPSFVPKENIENYPTTYHPTQLLHRMSHSTTNQHVSATSLPLLQLIEEDGDKSTRFSSSYNSKHSDFSILNEELKTPKKYNQMFKNTFYYPDILNTMIETKDSQAIKGLQLEDSYQSPKHTLRSSIKQRNHLPVAIDIADFTRAHPPQSQSEAYVEFKPLNIGEEIRIQPDIEQYLNRFGIVSRKRKQVKPEDSLVDKTNENAVKELTKNADVDMFSDNISQKAEDPTVKRLDTNVNDTDLINTQDQENLSQIDKLLNNLRELERLNVSLTADMLKSRDSAEKERNKNNPEKIDFKRQSTDDSLSDPKRFNLDVNLNSTEDSTISSKSASSTTEEPNNGSLADLEDSFGGPDPITEDPSPPPKTNGFYFLADWNSFLEVGEAGKDQVVVRFDPKIGDPKRFLKVTVP